jgi:cytochrome c oxidase assembly factor CtaG
VSTALPEPGIGPAVTAWTWQPVAIAAAVVLVGWYARNVRRLRADGRAWPVRRWVWLGFGLLVGLWAACGFWQVYDGALYWVWTAQVLILWLLVPALLLTARPVQLALAVHGRDCRLARALGSRTGRVLRNPLITPPLVPLLSGVLFFGPVPRLGAFTSTGWAIEVALVVLGAVILLPLLGLGEPTSTLAMGLTLAIGCVELAVNAVPGVVLRMRQTLVSSYFDHRTLHPWSQSHLADQHAAGSMLWVIAELLVVPFLLLVFRQWLRADARDAAAMDAVLDAEHAARAPLREQAGTGDADVPWWVTDPAWQERMHHHAR